MARPEAQSGQDPTAFTYQSQDVYLNMVIKMQPLHRPFSASYDHSVLLAWRVSARTFNQIGRQAVGRGVSVIKSREYCQGEKLS